MGEGRGQDLLIKRCLINDWDERGFFLIVKEVYNLYMIKLLGKVLNLFEDFFNSKRESNLLKVMA